MSKENKTSFVILGLLSHEPMTGYDIKKRIDASLKYFWSASFGSIYPALADLEKKKYVTKQNMPNEKGREKIIYEITEEGRQCLAQWLRQPIEKDELRYETILKLFFGKEAGSQVSLEHIDAFEHKIAKELPVLQGIVELLGNLPEEDGTHLYYRLSAKFGVKIYQAYLEWAEETRAELKQSEEMKGNEDETIL